MGSKFKCVYKKLKKKKSPMTAPYLFAGFTSYKSGSFDFRGTLSSGKIPSLRSTQIIVCQK